MSLAHSNNTICRTKHSVRSPCPRQDIMSRFGHTASTSDTSRSVFIERCAHHVWRRETCVVRHIVGSQYVSAWTGFLVSHIRPWSRHHILFQTFNCPYTVSLSGRRCLASGHYILWLDIIFPLAHPCLASGHHVLSGTRSCLVAHIACYRYWNRDKDHFIRPYIPDRSYCHAEHALDTSWMWWQAGRCPSL